MISVEFTFEDGTIKKIAGTKFRGISHKLDRPIKAVATGLVKDTQEYNDLRCAMKIGYEDNIETSRLKLPGSQSVKRDDDEAARMRAMRKSSKWN